MSWFAWLVGGIWEWFARRLAGAPGTGTMRAAAFVRYDGAMGAGHLGWGFDFDPSSANVGAVENPLGGMTGDPATMGYWNETTGAPVHTMQRRGYVDLRYTEVDSGDAAAAYRTVKWVAMQPYRLLQRNCMDDAYDVLRAYGVPNLPVPSHEFLPNEWFLQFQAAHSSVTSFVWTKEKVTPIRRAVTNAILKAAPSKAPTWPQPGHPDWHALQVQMGAPRSELGAKTI